MGPTPAGVGPISHVKQSRCRGATLGTFYYTKGTSRHFLYKNLSAGEKAVFDLLLDGITKAPFYDDSVWCIDEPEAHLSTRIQARVLDALLELQPDLDSRNRSLFDRRK